MNGKCKRKSPISESLVIAHLIVFQKEIGVYEIILISFITNWYFFIEYGLVSSFGLILQSLIRVSSHSKWFS